MLNILERICSMKRYSVLLYLAAVLLLATGCELVDKAKEEYERIKNRYEEYVGNIKRGPRPFEVVFQSDDTTNSTLVSPLCAHNQAVSYIHFTTQQEAQSEIFGAIKNLYSYPPAGVLKPFWDIRYTNPVSTYINGTDGSHYPNHAILTGLDARTGIRNVVTGTGFSQVDPSGIVVQSECVNNLLASGTTLNLFDAPEQSLVYAGIASTFIYQIHPDNHIRPWQSNTEGNLMLQASFDTPIYRNYENNIGGSIAFNVFLYNPKIDKHLNYVIGIYAYGEAWQREKAGIRFDPTTNIVHVATVIKDDSWWCTKSPKSRSIEEVKSKPNKTTQDDGKWPNFFRVNISYQNLLAALKELAANPPASVAGQNFGLHPEDWEVTLLAVQYELEEQGGKATLSGSFSNFGAYTSRLPL